MRPFLLWRSDWPVVGQHLCSILCCVACSGALGASLSTMRAFSIMRLSVFCCARWVEGIFSFIDCCWSILRVCGQKLLPLPLSHQRGVYWLPSTSVRENGRLGLPRQPLSLCQEGVLATSIIRSEHKGFSENLTLPE